MDRGYVLHTLPVPRDQPDPAGVDREARPPRASWPRARAGRRSAAPQRARAVPAARARLVRPRRAAHAEDRGARPRPRRRWRARACSRRSTSTSCCSSSPRATIRTRALSPPTTRRSASCARYRARARRRRPSRGRPARIEPVLRRFELRAAAGAGLRARARARGRHARADRRRARVLLRGRARPDPPPRRGRRAGQCGKIARPHAASTSSAGGSTIAGDRRAGQAAHAPAHPPLPQRPGARHAQPRARPAAHSSERGAHDRARRQHRPHRHHPPGAAHLRARSRCGPRSRRTWAAPTASPCTCARTAATSRTRTCAGCASSRTSS